MSKERYQFPLFDIVNVPFEVEGKIYCYSKFDIILLMVALERLIER